MPSEYELRIIEPVEPALRQHTVAPHAWGTILASHSGGLPNVETNLIFVPEGLLVLSTCAVCGAREESLVDFRDVVGHGSLDIEDSAELDRVLLAHPRWATVADETRSAFVQEHMRPHDAEAQPLPHAMAEAIERATQNMLSLFRQQEEAPALLTTVTRGRVLYLRAIPDETLDESVDDATRLREIEWAKHQVRDAVAKANADPIGVVFLSPALFAPGLEFPAKGLRFCDFGDRPNAVSVVTVTGSGAAEGSYVAAELSDGRAGNVRVEWKPVSGLLPIVDGAFAS